MVEDRRSSGREINGGVLDYNLEKDIGKKGWIKGVLIFLYGGGMIFRCRSG